MKILKFILLTFFFTATVNAQTAKEIIEKSDQILRGSTVFARMKITTIRPNWTKEMTLKSWSKGVDFSVSVVTSPAKEKGTVFLKRKNEIWSYSPQIERTIKLPPSMMMQGWMGTDLTNDDMVKQSSIVVDYTHKIIGSETLLGYDCWKLELIPHEDAAVVWGKIIIWIDKSKSMQLKVEFYDENDFLVNKLVGSKIKTFQGRTLPSKLEFIPVDEEGHQTNIEYLDWEFDVDIPTKYFTTQYMKRIR